MLIKTPCRKKYHNFIYLHDKRRERLLYQLACGKLPVQIDKSDFGWENVYNFNLNVFKSTQGNFLKDLIEQLSTNAPVLIDDVLKRIDDQLWHEQDKQLNIESSVEDSIYEHVSSKQSSGYKKL